MDLAIYQIDAFANQVFEGNPAAVCPLNSWISEEQMHLIAAENNLSETAFFVETDSIFHIRWFTPTNEVDLCGHATLASAYVIFNELNYSRPDITFTSKSGELIVRRNNELLTMNFPSQPPVECELPLALKNAFKKTPLQCLRQEDYILVFESEEDIQSASPDLSLLRELDLRGVCITARGNSYDFVSRFFAPKYGIDEDPVTGSSFTQLIPYWAEQLDSLTLNAKQISRRGGEVICELVNDRVNISGKAIKYLCGCITLK